MDVHQDSARAKPTASAGPPEPARAGAPVSPSRFLALLVALPIAVLAGTGAFTLAVDPFGLYRVLPVRAGLNANKARQRGHERMVRAADVRRLRPDALVLGTSRTQVGIDPDADAWRGLAQRPVNAAYSDGTVYEALRTLQHAQALSPVRLVVFGADYLSFVSEKRVASDFSEDRLAVDALGRPQLWARFADVPAALLSFDALNISRHTLFEQHLPSYFFDTGRRQPFTMAERLTEQGGVRATFLWSERDYADSYACARPERLETHLADFRTLADFARASGARLVVFTSPSHVRSQVLLAEAGLWPEVLRFKRALAAASFAAGAELWEFGGADPETTAEPVPPPGETTARMRWYWESSHYQKELGDVALARMLGPPGGAPQATSASAAPRFGVRVTPATLEEVFAGVASDVDAWRERHADEVAELRAVVDQARRERDCSKRAP